MFIFTLCTLSVRWAPSLSATERTPVTKHTYKNIQTANVKVVGFYYSFFLFRFTNVWVVAQSSSRPFFRFQNWSDALGNRLYVFCDVCMLKWVLPVNVSDPATGQQRTPSGPFLGSFNLKWNRPGVAACILKNSEFLCMWVCAVHLTLWNTDDFRLKWSVNMK